MMTLAIAASVKVGLMIAGGAVVAGGCGFGGYKIGKKIDVVFCGSDYDEDSFWNRCYEESEFVVFPRNEYNSTEIRKNVYAHWDWLPQVVRSYYTKKVLLIGSVSAGKSTLTVNLAHFFNTVYLEEVGRELSALSGTDAYMLPEDFTAILVEHKAKDVAAAPTKKEKTSDKSKSDEKTASAADDKLADADVSGYGANIATVVESVDFQSVAVENNLAKERFDTLFSDTKIEEPIAEQTPVSEAPSSTDNESAFDLDAIIADADNESASLGELISKLEEAIDEANVDSISAEDQAKLNDFLDEKREAARQEAMAMAGSYSGALVKGDPEKGDYLYAEDCPKYQGAYADPWGMYVCGCVSYVAWKVYQKNGYMYDWGGVGDARNWGANARAVGIEVSDYPRVGSVGYTTGGWYGHAVWVEAVDEETHRVYVSQYNYGTPGEYSEMWIDWDAYDYIYF